MDHTSFPDIPAFAKNIFFDALNKRASDVHIDPGLTTLRIRFRVDGSLTEYASFDMSYHEQLLSHIKVLSSLDTTAVYTPQDGHFSFNFTYDNTPITLDIRVSIFPTIYGDAAVFRIANSLTHVLNLDNLGMDTNTLSKVKKIIKRNNGMLLVTGPVGSGKTSALYSALNEAMDQDKNAITLEDPIEFRFEKVRQIQMNQEKGFTYAAGMKSILRQDPDIIMIGEIRDAETAEYAVRAALVGRLVFSTIHANSSVGTIARLIDMKIEKSLVAYALNGVIASRLVKKNCTHCLEQYLPSLEYLAYFAGDHTKHNFYRGKGCDMCEGKGYFGRIGIFEVLEFDTVLRSMIVQGSSMSDIQKYVDSNGTKTLKEDAFEKIVTGVISIENAVTVI
jgi:type II secretory ATPase GspE/PulE/Tfp pilus assembly ATPase PilB-like protein